MKSIEPKSKHAIIAGVSRENFKKVKPEAPTTPGVGFYKDADKPNVAAWDPKRPNYSFTKTKKPSIIAHYAKTKSSIPGVGKYTNADKQWNNLARHPSTVKSRLH